MWIMGMAQLSLTEKRSGRSSALALALKLHRIKASDKQRI
jgi:hypothetical protein